MPGSSVGEPESRIAVASDVEQRAAVGRRDVRGRPRVPEPVDRGARRRGERARGVRLAGDVVLHPEQVGGGVAVRGRPRPGRVAERRVRLLQEAPRRRCAGGRGVGERLEVPEVLHRRVTPLLRRRAVDRVGTDVAVVLVGEVGDVGRDRRPERRVLEPVLEVHLVRREVGRQLRDSRAEGDALHAVAGQGVQEREGVGAGAPGAGPHGRRELVERPGVAGRRVESRSCHPLARERPCVGEGARAGCDPARPARVADLVDRVEARPERPDLRGLPASRLRLVRGERRDGDVVLGAGGGELRERRREAKPVRLGVEDDARRPAARVEEDAWLRLRAGDFLQPERVRRLRGQRRHRLHGGRRGGCDHERERRGYRDEQLPHTTPWCRGIVEPRCNGFLTPGTALRPDRCAIVSASAERRWSGVGDFKYGQWRYQLVEVCPRNLTGNRLASVGDSRNAPP